MSSAEGEKYGHDEEYRRVQRSQTAPTALSRIGTLAVTLIAVFFVFVAKRYDLDEVLGYLGLEPMGTASELFRPGAPSSDGTLGKGYTICTRQRSGIYTVERGEDEGAEIPVRSQCLTVGQEGIITHVGSIDSVKASHPGARVRFLPPKAIIVPGLVDSHVHLLEYGWSRTLNLEGTRSPAQVVERVKEYILSRPSLTGEEWIEGVGWDQNLWDGWSGGFPTHDILDADPILRGRPIILFRVDLHAVWLSGRALELCGELPEKPEGGEIIRDHDGKPTGVLLDNAQLLVPRPDWSESQMREYFQRGTKDLLEWGVTAVHDAMSRDVAVKFYQKMADEGSLPLRVHLMGYMDAGYWNGTKAFHHYGVHQ
ncbi:hypothetical protein FRC17_007705, partial [Serendipita sp. 399]